MKWKKNANSRSHHDPYYNICLCILISNKNNNFILIYSSSAFNTKLFASINYLNMCSKSNTNWRRIIRYRLPILGKGKWDARVRIINAIRRKVGGHFGQNIISRKVSLKAERVKHIIVNLKKNILWYNDMF